MNEQTGEEKASNPTENREEKPVRVDIKTFVSPDKLKAYLMIETSEKGVFLSVERLKDALMLNKIHYGIDESALRGLCSKPLYGERIEVASGLAPVNGENAASTFYVNVAKSFLPKEKPDGSIDFFDLDIVENVSKGQLLCTISKPTVGTEGISVTNERIKPVSGKTLSPINGKHTRINKEGNEIYAEIDGQVEFDGKKINVNDSFYIENVDYTTGNIKVNGNLFVRGIIIPGFSVEAGGNIEIKGMVDSAKIRAGGNIVLRSGITVSEIHCEGDLTSRFIEKCSALVKGSIKSEFILNSNIKCGESLYIAGQLSKFLGGSCLVGKDIVVKDIGSPLGIPTEVELGSAQNLVHRQQELTALVPKLEKQIASLELLIERLQQLDPTNRLPQDKKDLLETALANCEANRSEVEDAKQELEKIGEMIMKKGFGKIICSGNIYPETRVKFGNKNMTVLDTLKGASLYYSESDGEIHMGSAT